MSALVFFWTYRDGGETRTDWGTFLFLFDTTQLSFFFQFFLSFLFFFALSFEFFFVLEEMNDDWSRSLL